MCEVKYIVTLFAAQLRTSYYNDYQTIHGVLLCYIGKPVVLTVILSVIDLFNIFTQNINIIPVECFSYIILDK